MSASDRQQMPDAPLATRRELTPKLGFALVVALAFLWLVPFLWMRCYMPSFGCY